MKTKTLLKFTGLFIVMLIICLVFSLLFGSENIIIAIMAMVLSIILIKQDLKKKLTINFLKILLTNLSIGILAFLSCKFITLSFLIVFLTIFLIVILTKNINKLIYYVFALEFVYLISSNINYSNLSMRLLSLIGASILVIIINVIVHSLINKKEESENQNFNSTDYLNTDSSTKLIFKEIIFSKFRKDKQHYLFAIELAIIVTISEFIAIYFKIPTAKWLSFTAIGILRPNTNLVTKGFKKIEGTIIGVIGFILIDILILRQGTIGIFGLNVVAKDIVLLLIVIFSYFYTMYYLKNEYVIRMVFSTLLALSIAFISIPQTNFITTRILFIIIGAILCIIINYFLRQSTEL